LPFKFKLYRYIADLVRINLLLADWNDPDHQVGLYKCVRGTTKMLCYQI
jgi:hypothetical protein